MESAYYAIKYVRQASGTVGTSSLHCLFRIVCFVVVSFAALQALLTLLPSLEEVKQLTATETARFLCRYLDSEE